MILRRSLVARTLLGCLAFVTPALAQEDDEIGELTPQEQIRALISQSQQQIVNEEFDAAVQGLTVVANAFEGGGTYSPIPYALRAKAYAGLKEYEPALEDLKKALLYSKQEPRFEPEVRNTRAEVYLELGAFNEALADAQEATKLQRANPVYQFNLGKALVNLGGMEQGEKALTRYLDAELPEDAEPDNEKRAEAFLLRGRAFGFLRRSEEAKSDIAASLELEPGNHEAYLTLAQLALIEEDFETAAAELEKSIANYQPEDPNNDTPFLEGMLARTNALEDHGKALARSGDLQGAQTAYQQTAEQAQELLDSIDPDAPEFAGARAQTLFKLAVANRLLGDYGTAVKAFSQSLEINPGFGDAYFRRGICFHYLGEYKLAIRDFEQASSINFESPRANLWKGMSYAKQGDYIEAIRAYGDSLAVSDRYTPAYINRGLAHLAEGDFDKAVDDFNEAIRLQPTEAMHYLRRGRAQSEAEDREAAIRSYQNAIQFDSRLRPAYEALAGELEASGRAALASEYRRRAAQLGL